MISEFNDRGESLVELETQLHNSTSINVKMQEKLNQYEDYSIKLKKVFLSLKIFRFYGIKNPTLL